MKDNEMRNERLLSLRDMKDYKVAKDNVDVVGWRVVGADGETLGTVKDLIVDPQVMKVRYLSVLAEHSFFNTEKDQHILVPIGAAALDKKGKNLFVSYIDSRSIGNYPVYSGDYIPSDYEYAVRESVQRAQRNTLPDSSEQHREEFDEMLRENQAEGRPVPDDSFYEHEAYNENRFYTSDVDYNRDRDYDDDTYERSEGPREQHDINRPKTVEDSIATIERLENLRKRGSITEEEFILMKKRALDL